MNKPSQIEVPVLLVRTGPTEVAAITPDRVKGWSAVGQAAAESLARLFSDHPGYEAGSGFSSRYFVARDEDLKLWDMGRNYGPEAGYRYGVAWGGDGKITGNVAFREVQPGAIGAPSVPIDPLMLATAAAMAQIQASLERLEKLLAQVGRDVTSIVAFLHLEQEASILAAVETIDQIHRGYRSAEGLDEVDWSRVAGLEQVLKQQHRQILGELQDAGQKLRFTTIAQANASSDVDPDRLKNLLTLEFFLLRSLSRWTELMLASKELRGSMSIDQGTEARQLVDTYTEQVRSAVQQIWSADTYAHGRPWYERLMKDGLILGDHNDGEARDRAVQNRKRVQAHVEIGKRLGRTSQPRIAMPGAGQLTAA